MSVFPRRHLLPHRASLLRCAAGCGKKRFGHGGYPLVKSFAIERGLLMEDRDVLLPWFATPEELRQAESPILERSVGSNGRRMYWRRCQCLGGLGAVGVST